MKEKPEQITPSCTRAEDLVTYLYGEASEQEAAQFRRHIERCASCKQEMAAFSRVREDVIEWRDQSLPSFDFQHAAAPLNSNAAPSLQKRSALAALRQFFTLAPAWMRAATAVAALAICALVVFTAIHFSERPEAVVQVSPKAPMQTPPEETIKPRSAQAVNQVGPQETRDRQAAIVNEKRQLDMTKDNNSVKRMKSRRATGATLAASQQKRATTDRVKASQEARQQLAELVQTNRDDDYLPRLSDLIEDSSDSN